MSDAPAVLVEGRDGIQIITINRADQRNAMNGEAARGIAAALDELEATDDLRVGVLTGAGGTFCSGMDLKGFLTGDSPVVGDRGFAGLTNKPPRKPLIAAVEGWAVAGGFEMVLACDLVVAAETAKFGVPEVKRGLVAGAGAALLLPKRIPGRSRSNCCSRVTPSTHGARLRSAWSTSPLPRGVLSTQRLSSPGRSRGTAPSRSRRRRRSLTGERTGPSRTAGHSRTPSCSLSSSPRTPRRAPAPSPRSVSRCGRGDDYRAHRGAR